MDFSNEPYVRVYTRNTTTWRRLEWQGQCVLIQMLRVVDRSGVLDIEDMTPAEAVSLHTGMPPDVAADGMARLLELGVCAHNGSALLFPRFLDAQESTKSDRQRQRESREKRRSAASQSPVTDRDSESQNVTERHELSQAVTSGHGLSQPVTLTSALLCSADPLPCSAVPSSGDAALVGFKFVASLLGRSTFDVPPLGAYTRAYTWIGSRPEAERETVRVAVDADPWCKTNPARVDAPHLERSWQKYLAGPSKTVVRADPRDADAADRVKALRQEYAKRIKAAREAGDEYTTEILCAERDQRVASLQARLAS